MTGEICIANIGPRGRARRLRFGVVMAAVTIGWLMACALLDLSRSARLLVFFPAWLAALGILQHREKT